MYNNEYYKVVRLKSGETLLCTMSNDVKSLASEPYIYMNIPVQVVSYQESRKNGFVIGESFILKPWIGLSDSEEFVISTDIVLTIGNLKKEIKQQYINYITETSETRNKILEREDRSEAAENLLRELSSGEFRLVEEPPYNIDGDFYEEDYDEEGR